MLEWFKINNLNVYFKCLEKEEKISKRKEIVKIKISKIQNQASSVPADIELKLEISVWI